MSDLPSPRMLSAGHRERPLRKLSAAVSSLPSSVPSQYRMPLLFVGLLAIALPGFFLIQTATWRAPIGGGIPFACMPGAPTNQVDRSSLPMLYFMAGVEGSGHDFWEHFFSYVPVNVSLDLFEPTLHLTHDPDQTVPRRMPQECPRMPYARHVIEFGSQIAARLAGLPTREEGGQGLYVRARDPFPMGAIRTPLARPDLINLALFDGIQYNLKVIALVRNLTEAVAWSVSRSYHAKDVGLQVRLVEDGLTYLDAQLRTLPCATYAAVNVDRLPASAENIARPLAKFLQLPGVGRSDVARALKAAHVAWRAPALDQVPMYNGEPVGSFFDKRQLQWPLLSNCQNIAFFQPMDPTHWPS